MLPHVCAIGNRFCAAYFLLMGCFFVQSILFVAIRFYRHDITGYEAMNDFLSGFLIFFQSAGGLLCDCNLLENIQLTILFIIDIFIVFVS